MSYAESRLEIANCDVAVAKLFLESLSLFKLFKGAYPLLVHMEECGRALAFQISGGRGATTPENLPLVLGPYIPQRHMGYHHSQD